MRLCRGSVIWPVVVMTGLAACGRSPAAGEDLVVVSASLTSTVLRLGDTTRISVSVLNAGTRAVTLDARACPWWFEVLKETTVVAPGEPACAAISDMRTIEPGASYSHVFTWRGERIESFTTPVLLGEGNYILRPAVRIGGAMMRGTPVAVQIVR